MRYVHSLVAALAAVILLVQTAAATDEARPQSTGDWQAAEIARVQIAGLQSHDAPYGPAITFSPDGNFLGVADMSGLRTWGLRERDWVSSIPGRYTEAVLFGDPCTGFARDMDIQKKGPDRPFVFRCADGATVRTLELTDWRWARLAGKSVILPSCDLVVADQYYGPIPFSLLDGRTNKALRRSFPRDVSVLTGFADANRCLIYAAVGRQPAPKPSPNNTASHKASVLYEIDVKTKRRRLVASLGPLDGLDPPAFNDIAVSPSGRRAILSTWRSQPSSREVIWRSNRLELIDLQTGVRLREFVSPPADDNVYDLKFAWLDETHVAYIASTGDTYIVNVETGRQDALALRNLLPTRPEEIVSAPSAGLLAIGAQTEVLIYKYRF